MPFYNALKNYTITFFYLSLFYPSEYVILGTINVGNSDRACHSDLGLWGAESY